MLANNYERCAVNDDRLRLPSPAELVATVPTVRRGGFAPRPIRPQSEWRTGLSTTKQPPSTKRVHLHYDLDNIAAQVEKLKGIAPEER
jgi:hypothetical protein